MENNIEKILGYIKGSLSSQEEKFFFDELSKNDELRNEFKSINLMENAISSAKFHPDAAHSASIFYKLGISASPSVVKSSFFTTNTFKVISISIVTFFLGYFLSSFLKNSENTNDDFFNSKQNSIYTQKINDNKFNKMLNVNENIDETENNKLIVDKSEKKSNQNKVENNIPVINKRNNLSGKNIPNFKTISLQSIDNKVNRLKDAKIVLANDYSKIENNGNDIDNSIINIIDIKKSKFILEYAHSSVWNMPTAKISPTEYSPVHNLGFGLYYKMNENFKIGMVLRQESYYLEYSGTENERLFDYEQQPNYTSFYIDSRYSPFNIYKFKPFISAGFGFNKGGFLFNGSLGTEFYIKSDIGLHISTQYNQFRFIHQSIWFNAQKLNLNFGIFYNF